MTWSDEVHASRLASSLAAARSERSQRAKGQRVQRTPDAGPVQLLFLTGVTTSLLLWQAYRPQLQKVQLPVLKQFHDLVYGSKGTKLGPAGGKAAGGQSKGKAKKNKKKGGGSTAPAAAPAAAPAPKTTSAPKATPAPAPTTAAPTTAAEARQSLKPSGSLRVPSGSSGGGAPPPSSPPVGTRVPSKIVTNPAPLQPGAVALFSKPHQPLIVETSGSRNKPAAKPAAMTTGLVRVPSNKTP